MSEVTETQAMVDKLVKKAMVSLEEFRKLNQDQVDYIVGKASVAALDKHGYLAELAVKETGRGVFEDKATKNLFACEHVVNKMRHWKTCDVIKENKVEGLVYIADPVGVVAGVTPVTNPTSTAIFKSLICLKTRNPIIFGFHPGAQHCSVEAARIVYEAAIEAGAPKDCIQWIDKPSLEATTALMNHPDVATILATGGNAMVRAAYSCGKPALGVGAGNVPAYVEKSANIRQAAHDIVMSKTFDNGMVCASEQAAIVDDEIYDEFVKEMQTYHVYVVNKKEKTMLEQFMFGVKAGSKECANAKLNPDVVGKSVRWICEQAGFTVPDECTMVVAECSKVGVEEPLTREKLSPVLALLHAHSREDGLKKAEQMVEFNGLGHSAAIHTADKELADNFGRQVKAIRVIWNSPSTFGGIGDVYNSIIPSLTLGCGSYGHNSVSNNISAFDLINIKRIGRRRNNMQWFKVPPKIYFERDSIQYLRVLQNCSRAMIVCDKSMIELGFVGTILNELDQRRNKCVYQLFSEVEPNPDITTVQRGVEIMNAFKPDTIIAIGGGSPMDAAKAMWMFYEHPEIDFRNMVQKFMDIRKRAFKFPQLGEKAQMVCIPTTSGTGSEVTPFVVISDKKAGKKYPVTDYALTPSIAIIDASLVDGVPSVIAADTGMDALTHATEAYVSMLSSDYTDGLALQAIRMIFEYLPRSVAMGAKDKEAKEKMHNAATIAGMSFANAFLGIVHSMSHKIGGELGTVHGRTNAVLLPYVIMYNGSRPNKLSTWPKYNYFRADEKYYEIANLLGLKPTSVEDGIRKYAKACRDLNKSLGMPTSFKEMGLDRELFMSKVHELAMMAYEDQCSPANPRLPMVEDMERIMIDAYDGKEWF
ncbi:bifunctional acetaldehyde-CoA/alcohol dehydrogenase [Amygdalobacter nucleatus]|uniref:Aldehyde-alcohol dehydrogenase n=1 Tax=Amygdalobacter nucleatus TaxID=3029274 RepID=A0A133YH72_9FIRM|nr:bifunctional acetaldehyde-CoA/alcohol dehydrogenase [Amygdalobacter nucleatus]KXB42533.1 aldehyde-alcohol dehydrogenase 2 [Amygdalobacter nucleatus]MDF0486107.1 bifunctional acetaldehyde-CoA/alcohol dehydrogenase [Amygdalobacter nucleatus]WEG37338.1 bifunctional acetaldehyde-CoA/alcohol dehydrogenase [Amygdalobacter nucleatus]